MEELVPLPGVGRKTANVILGNAFDVPGITVDTHVLRLSQRMGLTKNDDPEKIERDLMAADPAEGLDHFQPSHDLSRPAGLQRPQAQMRRMRTGEDLSQDRRRVAV